MSRTTAKKPSSRAKTSPSSKKTTTSRPGRKRRRSFSTYQAALKCLYDRINVEKTRVSRLRKDVIKLERMHALMEALGNPQDDVRYVHVAGTKGKGSVCAMTASALEACGYTVGVYTSPHLVDLRERVQINGVMIPEEAFMKVFARCEDAGLAIEKKHGKPTFFEMMTAVALVWFAEQAVDVAIVETGLGGRLDATNVITPEVVAITGISRDHTQILGDSLESIAREKAGIFKQGVPALTIAQPDGVLEEMCRCAEEAECTLEIIGKDIDFSHRFEVTPGVGPHTCVCLSTERSAFEHVNVPLPGEHQALNCGLALAIVDRLREKGFETPETTVIEGLANTSLPGRMEIVSDEPKIVLDGAHNSDSLAALMKSIGIHTPYDSLVVVFGCCEDKDVDDLLKRIAMGADKIIFTRAKGSLRAVDPQELQQRFTEIAGKMTQVAETFPEALELAERAVSRGDLICVTGSFFLVGEAKKHLKAQERELVGA